MWFEMTSDASSGLAAATLQIVEADNPLANAVGESCLTDLCLSLWGSQAAGIPEPTDPPDSQCRDPRHGGLAFRIAGLPFDMRLLVDWGWCEQEVPRASSQRPGLVERRKAIGATRLSLRATVELGQIPLLDSTEWSPGELLLTDASHLLPVDLVLSGRTILTGVLGKHPGSRTIQIS